MGAPSCGPLCSRLRVPRFFLHVPRSCTTLFLRSPIILCNSSHARCVCMDGSGGPGQLATAPLPPPLVTRARCMCVLAGSRFELLLVSRPPSPLPPLLSDTHHNCVISSQEREFSVPILSRSCIKFAFLRALVPKIPGTWERGNAKPGTRSQECVPISENYSKEKILNRCRYSFGIYIVFQLISAGHASYLCRLDLRHRVMRFYRCVTAMFFLTFFHSFVSTPTRTYTRRVSFHPSWQSYCTLLIAVNIHPSLL